MSTRNLSACICAMLVMTMILATTTVAAQDRVAEAPADNGNGNGNGDLDAPPEAKNRITDSLSYGVKLMLDLDYERNFDLDTSDKDDLGTIKPQVELALAYQPDATLLGFVNLELLRRLAFEDQGEREDRNTQFIVDEAYVLLQDLVDVDDVFEDVALQVGRQKIDDSREWLLDQELDAVRLFFESFDVDVELSISRENLVQRDLLQDREEDRINNFIAFAEYEVVEDRGPIDEIEAAAYAVYRDNRSDRDDLLFVGVRSTGEIGGLAYWADFAHVRGNDGSDSIRGYGFDLGAVYTFNAPFRPHVVLGYAFGSGDDNLDDNVDRNFRQTDLQGNSDKLGGVVSVNYYGEVFDPELSNMSILTAGVGFRPSKYTSIEAIYHHYWQDAVSDEVRDASVEEDLEGERRDLGSEIDLVFGYRGVPGFKAELVLGYFEPGSAYDDDVQGAFLAKAELSFEF